MTRLLVLPGNGIGPEIVSAAESVLSAADSAFNLGLTVSRMDIGFAALEAKGTTIPDSVIDAATAFDGVILGPVSHNEYPPAAEGGRNPSGVLRAALGPVEPAAAIEAAVEAALAKPETRTRDLGGQLGAAAFAAQIVRYLEEARP